MNDEDFLIVAKYLAKAELLDMLSVMYREKPIEKYDIEAGWQVAVNCNDLFFWGCSDLEVVTPETLPFLEKAIKDCKDIDDNNDPKVLGADPELIGMDLYCCRQRGMRPQGACYPKHKEYWPLIDACGEERELGVGNPYPPGITHSSQMKEKE